MSVIDILTVYAMSFLGTPYKWGGANPIEGMDCSGLVQEVLRSVGMDPPGDQTAQSLYEHFNKQGQNQVGPGALVFYGSDLKKITHVAFCIDDNHCIEAGGGGALTLTREDAARKSAFVRIRPVKNRKDVVAVVMPSYPSSP